MSLLEHPDARKLLADARVTAAAVTGCEDRLKVFLGRYLPFFYRSEQRRHAKLAIQGRLSGLERKTSEPIAIQAGKPRKPLQTFVGAGKWDDEAVMAEVRRHVREELGHPEAVLVLDSSGFPKKGTASCGVQRQWCGALGKKENCQVGVFLTYAAALGHAPLDRQLYVPKAWSKDRRGRRATHVPKGLRFQEKGQIAKKLIQRAAGLPHRWVTGDDEFGRGEPLRAWLGKRGEKYVLDVPCNTLVRALEARPPQGKRKMPFERVEAWAARQPASRWQRFTVRDGEKGPLQVEAMNCRVQTKAANRLGREECVVVIRTVEAQPRTWYALSNAGPKVALQELVRVKLERHRIEEMFAEGKGEVGLDHYEVRSWVGWHHHMTLSMLALWFLVLEKRRLGKKNPGPDRGPNPRGLYSAAAQPAAHAETDCRRRESGAAA